ncbi:META domain-containing protein [Parabacteroides sp. OttesenSCG-928-K15]|nr:META domain-containing protein [Parabacteroides sp. OttesenSCG-928-K15]
MKTRVTVVAAIAALLTLMIMQGCSVAKQATRTDLDGEWILKTINGKEVGSLFEKGLPTLKFDFAEKIISGTGGCNRYTGRFVMINNLLSSPDIVSTRMFCVFPNAENEYLEALRGENRLTLKEGILQFRQGKKIVLEFEKIL